MIGCVQFEEIKAMEPAKYIGDSFERVSRILVVTLYNIACCYSALKVADAGLEALEECLRSGFDDYGKVSSPTAHRITTDPFSLYSARLDFFFNPKGRKSGEQSPKRQLPSPRGTHNHSQGTTASHTQAAILITAKRT